MTMSLIAPALLLPLAEAHASTLAMTSGVNRTPIIGCIPVAGRPTLRF